MHIETYQTEITNLLKWHLFGGVEPMPRFTGGAYCLVFAIKSDLHLASFVDILIYIVAPKCICSCEKKKTHDDLSHLCLIKITAPTASFT